MTKALTDRFVAGIQCATRDNFFDDKVRGLVLRVSRRGKVWSFTYRRGGNTRWLKLGTYPALSLAEARRLAGIERSVLDVEKKDPIEERRLAALPPPDPKPAPAAPRSFTFADFVPVFIAFQKGKKQEWKADQQMIDRHLLPRWGDLPLKDIKRPHIHELLDALVAEGLTVGVNRVQSLISRMFTVALDRSLIDAHPAARMIKRFDEHARDVTLTDDQIRALRIGLDAQPGAPADVTWLRLLLGQRGEQTASMVRAEIDLDHATWTKPRRQMKRRKGTPLPHVVILPPTALAIIKRRIEALPEHEARVFPGLHLKGDQMKALSPLTGGAYTWIDLRRTVSTRLAELGFDEVVIDRVLDHARSSVTAKHYDKHQYIEEIRQALTAWEQELQRILAKRPKATKVLPMRRRR